MTSNPDDPAPPSPEYPFREQRIENGGTFGLIIMIVSTGIAIAGYHWLDNRTVAPQEVETTGSASASALPHSPSPTSGRDCIQSPDPLVCR
jgi:hypothetical protein